MTSPYKPKVALCFLVYDRIVQESVWNSWLAGQGDYYSVYIHSKEPLQINMPDVKYQVIPRVPTGWGTLGLVNAELKLFEAALEEHTNAKFVLVSGDCVPIKPAWHVYNELLGTPNSFIEFAHHSQVFPRYDSLRAHFDRANIVKHSQWVALSRKHASYLVMKTDTISELFAGTKIPDECVFGTMLMDAGEATRLVVGPGTMYVDWERGDPYRFTIIRPAEFTRMIESPEFFARKFSVLAHISDGTTRQSLFDALRSVEVIP
jgi:hypothetical protein